MDIEKEFQDLKKVIEKCGEHARDYFYSPINPNTQKEDGSLVTEIDEKIESILRAHVEERFPDDSIVGEEGDIKEGTSGFVWFIDPIDGTENFTRKIPIFSVTATRLGPTVEDSFAIVYNPISKQIFSSLMENGSYENEHLLNMTADTIGGRCRVSASGDTKYESWIRPAVLNLWKGLYNQLGKSGNMDSALLELAYVASGRIDGFLGVHYKPWDSAAGLYLVKAAGGAISVFSEGTWTRYNGAIRDLYGQDHTNQPLTFVSHPDIHQEVLDFVGDPKDWAEK